MSPEEVAGPGQYRRLEQEAMEVDGTRRDGGPKKIQEG